MVNSNMKARKMFEQLGYSLTELYGGATLIYENKNCETKVVFHTHENKGNRLDVQMTGTTYQDSGMLTFAELKAINKQVKELGWKDDTREQVKWVKSQKEQKHD